MARSKEYFLDLSLPFGGLDESTTFHRPRRRTVDDAQNVLARDAVSGQARLAQRPGISNYIAAQANGSVAIQDINHCVTLAAGMSSTRTVRGLVVANGDLKKFTSAGYAAITSGGGSLLSTSAKVVFSTRAADEVNGKRYILYVDGGTPKKYDIDADTAGAWTLDAGTLPSNPRLICTWMGRVVLAGTTADPHNYFMSRTSAPLNFDYAPATATEIDATAGNQDSNKAGLCPDIINTLVPYWGDLLVFGCDHSIWCLKGNPLAGGRIDLITNITGMAWGRPWTIDPYGFLYFFGSRGGVYKMDQCLHPIRISQPIEERLADIDLSAHNIRLEWDDRLQGVWVFITPHARATASTHFFYDWRHSSGEQHSWWPVKFKDSDHNPLAVHVYDGDDPDDRVLLLGTHSDLGRINYIDYDADDDAGELIDSYVLLGPIQRDNLAFMVKEIQAVLASGSSGVTLSVQVGESSEAAKDAAAAVKTDLFAGRSRSQPIRRQGHACYIKLANGALDERWALESLLVKVQELGLTAQRRF